MNVEIGTPATLLMYSDRRGLVVVGVSKTGYKLTLETLKDPSEFVDQSDKFKHGFRDVNHNYTEEEVKTHRTGSTVSAYLHNNGHYYVGGTPIHLGDARYHWDASF